MIDIEEWKKLVNTGVSELKIAELIKEFDIDLEISGFSPGSIKHGDKVCTETILKRAIKPW